MNMKRVLISKGGMNEDAVMDLRGRYHVVQESMTDIVILVPERDADTVAASNGGLVEING
jgi:hypothetical protein